MQEMKIQSVDMQQLWVISIQRMYLAGLVDQSDPSEVTKYLDKAADQARNMYLFRGAAQFALPTAVVPRIEVQDKNGTWYGYQTLVNKYQS